MATRADVLLGQQLLYEGVHFFGVEGVFDTADFEVFVDDYVTGIGITDACWEGELAEGPGVLDERVGDAGLFCEVC